MISYKPLWKTLIDKEITRTELREKTGISTATLAKLGKNEAVSLSTLDTICEKLECNIKDVVSFEFEKKNN